MEWIWPSDAADQSYCVGRGEDPGHATQGESRHERGALLALGLGRLIAACDGIELPEVLRDAEASIDRDVLYGIKPPKRVVEEVHTFAN